MAELRQRGLWNEAARARRELAEGSLQQLDELPDELRRAPEARMYLSRRL